MGEGNVRKTVHERVRFGERSVLADTRRDLHNAAASARLLALSLIVSAVMGVAGWAFLAALRLATSTREAHLWLFALLPLVNIATAWLYRNHGLRSRQGNNLVIDSTLTGTPIHARMGVLTFQCGAATHLA